MGVSMLQLGGMIIAIIVTIAKLADIQYTHDGTGIGSPAA